MEQMGYSSLYEKSNYLLSVPYVYSTIIREYDLSKANISSLLYMGYLSKDEYDSLYMTDKMTREICIGNLERKDKKVSELKKQGIKEARRLLFFENNLSDNEILSIKNDAVFIMGSRNIKSDFGIFDFKLKNTYSFFCSTSTRLEIYYGYDPLNENNEVIDIKGINDQKLLYHKDYMISFLCEIFYLLHTNTIEYVISFFNDFYQKYIDLKLDVGYYREFYGECYYRLDSTFAPFGFEYIDDSYLQIKNGRPLINIDCNLRLLRDIYSVLSDIYFSNKRCR